MGLDFNEPGGKILQDARSYGDESVTYSKSSGDGYTLASWSADVGPRDFFNEIAEDFDPEDDAEVKLEKSETGSNENEGSVETIFGEMTDFEDFYKRVGFMAVGNEDYDAIWERSSDYDGVEDNRISFLLKSEESIDNSRLGYFIDRTLNNSEEFYDDAREFHNTDFEDLKSKLED
jgi:hypothetical protein